MSDILAVFGILSLLGVAYPGLLMLNWLSFPTLTGRAREQVARHPVRSFWSGTGFSLVLVLPVVILLSLPSGLGKALGWILILAEVSVSSLGAAGLALELGSRLSNPEPDGGLEGKSFAHIDGFIRGAVILELASVFPLIGWLVVLPFATLACFGAAVLAIFSRKQPGPASAHILESNPSERKVSSHDALAS